MKICEVLNASTIIPELKATTKDEAIDELLSLFKDDKRVLDLVDVKNSVIEREKIMSTGVGHGFGIPHCKTNKVTEIVAAFGKTKEPIDFEALDGNPVNLIFLLIGKDNLVAPHINPFLAGATHQPAPERGHQRLVRGERHVLRASLLDASLQVGVVRVHPSAESIIQLRHGGGRDFGRLRVEIPSGSAVRLSELQP